MLRCRSGPGMPVSTRSTREPGTKMRILFVHQNFPAQFGHVARHLIRSLGWRCDFVSETPAENVEGIHKVQYKTCGGARETTHYFSRSFENAVWHAHAVYQACA